MSTDLLLCDASLRDILSAIERDLQDAAAATNHSARRPKLQSASNKLEEAQRTYEIFRSETRHLFNSDERATYEKVGENLLSQIHAFRSRHREIERGAGATMEEKAAADERAGTISNYAQAVQIQDDSLGVLRRAQAYGAQAEAVATATAERLAEQTERLSRIEEQTDELSASVRRARRELLVFFRTAATDKCFIVLFALVGVCILFVLAWQAGLKDYLVSKKFNPLGLIPPPVPAPAVPGPAVPRAP